MEAWKTGSGDSVEVFVTGLYADPDRVASIGYLKTNVGGNISIAYEEGATIKVSFDHDGVEVELRGLHGEPAPVAKVSVLQFLGVLFD